VIRLEGLRVRAGGFSLAIDELTVCPGEYLMVLGPTASGKTVLLETLAGLRRPDAGAIWFGEREVTGDPPERRAVGLVYQDYALFPHLTVAENIGFGLRRQRVAGATARKLGAGDAAAGRRERQDSVRSLGALVGIEGLLDRHPDGLSGGEQQRVALARALAIRPEVLLLDEPLSALDGPTRAELRRELLRLHRELGTTVLHVTHDLDEAMALGDRMAVLIEGRLRQVGTPQEVTLAPADAGVARLVGLTNLFPVADSTALGAQRLIRLENGLALISEGEVLEGSGPVFAVMPAEEVEVRPLDGSGSPAAIRPQDGPVHRSGAVHGALDAGQDNLLEGLIVAVRMQSVHAVVEVEVSSSLASAGAQPIFTAHVLRPQVAKMGLVPGLAVHLRIPARAVHVCFESAADRRV
jgi:ABC-type sugar transport system ATPase subunit